MINYLLPPTPLQQAAFDAALAAPLRKFRRGWAHDKAGPLFHLDRSIAGLEARGLIRVTGRVRQACRVQGGAR